MPENEIHPTAIIGRGVELGTGNTVGPYTVLEGPMTVGDGNWFGSHCVVGAPAQWTGTVGRSDMGRRAGNGIRIGNENVIREFVTIHQGTDRVTVIGDATYLMAYAHVPHDAFLADGVTLANAVQMGGHTAIGWNSNLGLGTVVHQRQVIGPYAMVGMQSVVTTHLPPGVLAFGAPARIRGVNRVGLERAGFDSAEIEEIASAFGASRRPAAARLEAALRWYEERVTAKP